MLQGILWLETLKTLLASGKPVPWKFVHSWSCINCGECCKRYVVELTTEEWIKITRFYGFEVITPGISKYYLRKRSDGSCVFLYSVGDKKFCGLQSLKPKPCKLWPFYIREKPVFGFPDQAIYYYKSEEFYIYVDPFCRGLIWGNPSKQLVNNLIPEVLEIKLGRLEKQVFSTASLGLRLTYPTVKTNIQQVNLLERNLKSYNIKSLDYYE